ncbi:MAG TPA: hypothetical protein PKY29_04320 [Ferruginibacter sp.]|nr:hypothetical protein [Ferruginibacter sp.]HRQ20513.1 hypothetical protein [Ferruginibacter sp.]
MILFSPQNPLHNNFVQPELCIALTQAGVSPRTLYTWKLRGFIAELHTLCFDPERIYEQMEANIEFIHRKPAYPAFSISDVENMLPDFYLERSAIGDYHLNCDNMYGLEQCTHKRLPDVFALMVLQAIKRRVISPEAVTIKLNQLNSK